MSSHRSNYFCILFLVFMSQSNFLCQLLKKGQYKYLNLNNLIFTITHTHNPIMALPVWKKHCGKQKISFHVKVISFIFNFISIHKKLLKMLNFVGIGQHNIIKQSVMLMGNKMKEKWKISVGWLFWLILWIQYFIIIILSFQ